MNGLLGRLGLGDGDAVTVFRHGGIVGAARRFARGAEAETPRQRWHRGSGDERRNMTRRHLLALIGATAGCGAISGSAVSGSAVPESAVLEPAVPESAGPHRTTSIDSVRAVTNHLLQPAADPPGGLPVGAPIPPYTRSYRSEFRKLVRCGERILYVAGRGSDSHRGTVDAPLRQISTAILRARPGYLILVDSGNYGFTEVRGVHGSPGQWLGIMTLNDQVNAVINVPPPTDNFVNVIGSSYVGIYGFEVHGQQDNPNTNGSGISVYGNSHHIALWRNHVHDFPGGGINCFDVDGSHDVLDLRYNIIHGTSRYSPNNTSGISIFASRDLTGGATFPDGYGYRIIGNYIYDVVCTVPYTVGGFNFATDGNGISLDQIKISYGYAKPILVAGNIVVGCGGRAIHVPETVNVDICRNTVVGNVRTRSPAITNGVEIQGFTDRTVRIIDNIICPLNTRNSTDPVSTYAGNVIAGGSQAVPPGNVDRRSVGLRYFTGPLPEGSLWTGPAIAAFTPAFR